MRTEIKISFIVITLFVIVMAISGCSDAQLAVKEQLSKQIAAKLPPKAQLVADSEHNAPLYFKAWEMGLIYFVGNGEICLTAPLSSMDIIKLNQRTAAKEAFTEISINEEVVYQIPGMRYRDNRFYFITEKDLRPAKPE